MAEEKRRVGHRPESTIVQSFSADLDSMFGLSTGEGGVDHLSQTVQDKKQELTTADKELQELEARLRETEQRLAQVSRGNSPARQANTGIARTNQRKAPVTGAALGTSPLAQKPRFPADRPPTAREDTQTVVSKIPGGMPETPLQQSGNSEYVMVDRSGDRSGAGYGQSYG